MEVEHGNTAKFTMTFIAIYNDSLKILSRRKQAHF